MTSIDLGNGQRLELEPALDVLRLVPAVTGAQLELRVRVGVAGGPGTARRLRIAAAVYVSRAAQQRRRLLGRVRAEHLVTPTARATEVGLVGEDQLRVVEELRAAGGEVCVSLAVDVSALGGHPPGLAGWSGDLTFPVRAGEWGEQLERVDCPSEQALVDTAAAEIMVRMHLEPHAAET